MAFLSTTINPAATTPAQDISKIVNDLAQIRLVLGGGTDAAIPMLPAANTIRTVAIQDLAVTTAKIAAAAVTPAKLSTGGPSWDTAGNLSVPAALTTGGGITAGAAVTGAGGTTAQATEAVRGTLAVASAAQVTAGTDDLNALTSKKLRDNGRLQKFYESPQQTITSAGALTLAHNLGVSPLLTQIVLINTTAEAGYTAGQELVFGTFYDDGTSVRGASIIPTSTSLTIRYSSAANVFVAPNATTGARTALTNASWRAVFRAWG